MCVRLTIGRAGERVAAPPEGSTGKEQAEIPGKCGGKSGGVSFTLEASRRRCPFGCVIGCPGVSAAAFNPCIVRMHVTVRTTRDAPG
jgi:hypothetical protein